VEHFQGAVTLEDCEEFFNAQFFVCACPDNVFPAYLRHDLFSSF
jgi:hypothetical protein